MAKYTTLGALFTAIANAIRNKSGGSGKIVADDFPEMIGRISTGITPTGTKTITANGTHDVTNYASAEVNVPASGITPVGTLLIIQNGEYDVSNFESVNVSVAGGKIEKHEITIASDYNSEGEKTLLTNNAFIKEHYSKDGFYVVMRPKGAITKKLGYGLIFVYHGNRQLVSGISATYGTHTVFNSGGTGTANANISGKVNGTTWNLGFRATSAGKLSLYTPASRPVAAGTYELFLVCEE
jgi:hypothetical protein